MKDTSGFDSIMRGLKQVKQHQDSENVTGIEKTPEELCKAKVRAVLALMRPKVKCAVWVPMATHDEGGFWMVCRRVPSVLKAGRWHQTGYSLGLDARFFDLPPWDGDWKDSLVRRDDDQG